VKPVSQARLDHPAETETPRPRIAQGWYRLYRLCRPL